MSVFYHVDAMNSTRLKRKRSATAASFETYRGRVWQLLQHPQYAGRLRSITLLSSFDHGEISEDLPLSQFCDIRKYRGSALVEKDFHIDCILDVVRQNAPELHFFE
jgi:hypothetical protein